MKQVRHETVAEYLKRGGKITKLKRGYCKRGKESAMAKKDFERHRSDDLKLSESLEVKTVQEGECMRDRMHREMAEYARNTGRCGLSVERLIGNLLD